VHNVSNACAVAAATTKLGVSAAMIQKAFERFAGIRRRMSLVGEARGIRIFDDFAHHPTAIKGMVSAAKYAMSGDGKLWVIVEPRSNTMRSRIHQQRLPQCFADADRVIFTPASDRSLAANEVLDAGLVCKNIGNHAQVLENADSIIQELSSQAQAGDDILILSNGGFDGIHHKLLKKLKD
ncbi:MAG: cyanophycin synthetase, partial [Mariprofundaceae bacterium]|nr:cyanophycin synthetase [Mariprofundaceae bacterium]